VAAVEGVVQSEKEDAAFAIGAVTLMGTLYMALYPALYSLMGPDDVSFALWAGSSIHEVAQVAAAGSAIRDASVEPLASTVKMIRVLGIVPLTFILLFFNWKENRDEGGENTGNRISVPWFALMFFAVVIVNSLSLLPEAIVRWLNVTDSWLMTGAMAGLGLGLSFKSLGRIGKKAIVLGVVSSLFISLVSATAIFFEGPFSISSATASGVIMTISETPAPGCSGRRNQRAPSRPFRRRYGARNYYKADRG
jgi:uncharacterized integral membrane protein (TIGR00698 family)